MNFTNPVFYGRWDVIRSAIPSLISSTTTYDDMPWEKSANQLWYSLTGETHPKKKFYIGPNKN